MRKKLVICMIGISLLISGCSQQAKKTSGNNGTEESSQTSMQIDHTTIETGNVPANSNIESNESEREEEAQETIETEENVEKCDGKIMEALSTEGSFEDFSGWTNHYSFHIPQFNDDSVAAKKINDRIMEEYNTLVQAELKSIEAKEMPSVEYVLYRCFEKEDLFTLVIECSYSSGPMQYSSYSYNFATQNEVSNKEMIKMGGMTESQFEANAKAKSYQMIPATTTEYTESEMASAQDIINGISSDVPMYLDEDGVINACIPYPSFADTGILYQWMTFTPDEE